jgi:glycosyltransferase involved in cell wall biosynthesis
MLRSMARGLVQSGIIVDVATTDDNGHGRMKVSHTEPIVEDGVTFYYFPRQTRFYSFSWPLTRWLKQHVKDYDLVHIHALFSYAAIPAAYWAKSHAVPYIVRPLGVLNRWGMKNRRPWLKKLSFSLIDRRILAGTAAIHFTSEQERTEAGELGIKNRAVVIPNAAELPIETNKRRGQFRARHPQLADRTIILFLSRLDSIKGLDLLLPAFAQARKQYPCSMLVIAGSGEAAYVSHLQQEAARLGIASDMIWTGFLAGEEKWAAFRDADIFVLPSYSENFGVAAVEAMACGLPVVVSDQVAIHWEISDARAGLVVPCETVELTQALAAMLADNRLRMEMGANGYRLARIKFSSETVWKRLADLYRETANPV